MLSPVKASEAKPSGRGWNRTSSLLLVRQALSALELPAQVRLRDKDSNLDLHVQSVASSPVRRSRIGTGRCPPSTPQVRGRRSARLPSPVRAVSRTTEAERCFPCHSPTLRPWIAADAVSYVEERWSPALLRSPEIRRRKQRLIQQRIRMRGWRRGTFLSQAGPRVSVVAFHVEHHPSVLFDLALTTTKATLSGRPRLGAEASKTLACIPPSEGFPIVRPAHGATRPEAGRMSGGGGRFGEEHLDVGGQYHRVSALYRVVP
jgi:hypothetical protein